MKLVFLTSLFSVATSLLIVGEHRSDEVVGNMDTMLVEAPRKHLIGEQVSEWHLLGAKVKSESELVGQEVRKRVQLKRRYIAMQQSWEQMPTHNASAHSLNALLQKPPGQSIKTIFVNSQYGAPEFVMQTCPVQCDITTQKSKFAKADAAVFNARWMAPFTEVPSSKPHGQKWVFNFFYEAPIYKGERIKEVETEQLSKMTDWTMTFNHASDFWSPMAKMVALAAKDRRQLRNTTPNGTKNFAAGRKYLLLWFVSSCDGGRMQLFEQLARKLPRNKVHMYGACGEPSPCPGRNESDACYQKLFAKYKFYASFENSRCAGYITEKFFRPLNEGMVPLVLGGKSTKDYEHLAPRGSFVDASRFSSLNALARYLRKVDRDDKKYNKFFGWRSRFRIADPHEVMEGAYCELCQNLHWKSSLQKPVRSFRDLSKWWYSESCRSDAPSWVDDWQMPYELS